MAQDQLKVKASDGKSALYTFKIYDHVLRNTDHLKVFKKSRYTLTEANFTHKPAETYKYTEEPPSSLNLKPKMPLLKAKHLPNGRFQKVDYYHRGVNHVDMSIDEVEEHKNITIHDPKDYRYHRVMHIKRPLGPDGEAVITHRFI